MMKNKTIPQIAAKDAENDFNALEAEFLGPYTLSGCAPDEGYLNGMGSDWMRKHLGVSERGYERALSQWNKTYTRVWNSLYREATTKGGR